MSVEARAEHAYPTDTERLNYLSAHPNEIVFTASKQWWNRDLIEVNFCNSLRDAVDQAIEARCATAWQPAVRP